MKRSAGQFENQMKVIIVAALAKEFKRAKIVKRVIEKAKSLGQVATGGLITPSFTGSIIPSSDDRWLIKKDAVVVRVTSMKYGVPTFASIRLKISYGLAKEYYWLTEDSDSKAWHPDGTRIMNWIKAKGDRGRFKYKGKPLDTSKEYQVKNVAYHISKSIAAKGIKKTKLFSPFKDPSNGVQSAVNKALPKAYVRISSLYGTALESSVLEMLEVFE